MKNNCLFFHNDVVVAVVLVFHIPFRHVLVVYALDLPCRLLDLLGLPCRLLDLLGLPCHLLDLLGLPFRLLDLLGLPFRLLGLLGLPFLYSSALSPFYLVYNTLYTMLYINYVSSFQSHSCTPHNFCQSHDFSHYSTKI